jgi:two-component system OmpR family response regulator/two-component system response regulator QseB
VTYLVDANVLSEPTKPNPDARVIDWLRANEPELAVDPIVIGELRFGILLLPRGKRRAALERWFDGGVERLHCLPWDADTGRRWAELLARLRAAGNRTPVLILTARDALEDRVRGLDAGADDYMVKPFQLEELAARLRALVRRAHGEAAPVLSTAGVTLDPGARTVAWRGREVELPAREFDVLHELMLNAGRVLSREHLQERVYRWGEEVGSNAIDVHVHHLRRKLAPELIRTHRGQGYQLVDPKDVA